MRRDRCSFPSYPVIDSELVGSADLPSELRCVGWAAGGASSL